MAYFYTERQRKFRVITGLGKEKFWFPWLTLRGERGGQEVREKLVLLRLPLKPLFGDIVF